MSPARRSSRRIVCERRRARADSEEQLPSAWPEMRASLALPAHLARAAADRDGKVVLAEKRLRRRRDVERHFLSEAEVDRRAARRRADQHAGAEHIHGDLRVVCGAPCCFTRRGEAYEVSAGAKAGNSAELDCVCAVGLRVTRASAFVGGEIGGGNPA